MLAEETLNGGFAVNMSDIFLNKYSEQNGP
jgi:hypothetical protein